MADTTQELSDNRSMNEINKSNLALKKEINEARAKELAYVRTLNREEREANAEEKAALKKLKEKQVSLNNQLKIQQEIVKAQRAASQEQITQYSNVESSIGSISSAMGSLKDNLRAATKLGVNFSNTISNGSESSKEFMRQASTAGAQAISAITSLSALNAEDSAQRAEYTQEYKSQYSIMAEQLSDLNALEVDGRTRQGKATRQSIAELQKQMGLLDEAFVKADKFSNVQKDVKELYEEMHDELGAVNKIIQKGINYGKIFFSSFSGAMTVIGFAAGYVADEFGKINAQIGGGLANLIGFKLQLTALSLILGEEAVAGVTELAARFGNVDKISNDLATSVGLLPKRLGVSGKEAGVLVNQFGNLSGLSNEISLNTVETTNQLAAANGVISSQVFNDLAQNTEFFAKYSKDGGKNIRDAAISAAQLGVDLDTAAQISDSLLDYQTSVAAEMEASVILGKSLNLQKARELAFAGDSAGAMKEAIKQAGTLAELEAMNPIERVALAKAIGVTNAKLLQMIANEREAIKPVDAIKASFNKTSAVLDNIASSGMGKWLGGTLGVLSGIGTIGKGISAMGGKSIPALVRGMGQFISLLVKGEGLSKAFSVASAVSGGASTAAALTSAKKLPIKAPAAAVPAVSQSLAAGAGGINSTALLKGAGALILAAGAIYILAKALQEFKSVGVNEILGLAAALVVVGLSLVLFGTFAGPIVLGAVALGFASIALGMFGAALQIVGDGLGSITTPFAEIVTNLSTLSSLNISPIYEMSTALMELSKSLALVVGTGGLALPILNGLNGLGLINTPVVGEVTTNGINTNTNSNLNITALIEEVMKLTNAIKGEELIVNIDGREIARGMRKYLKNT